MRKRKEMQAKLDTALDYILRQEETMIVLREELRDTRDANTALRAKVTNLQTVLDNARADNATQAAFLREGYRSKTGEIL